MKFNGYVVFCYGILVMLGGLIGYLTADSLPSLIAGTVFGATLIAGSMGILRNSIVAFFVSLGTSGALALFFAFRYYTTSKMMPAGFMGILSLLIFLMLLTTKGKPSKDAT